ncbi:Meiotically up-regulated gene 158 protein [Termitomyces sp. J132]|nr:Meiotically up-regulated gene 158 protein [Termitomyces sp. J132]
MLLYNERGLQLYDDITTKATEYYPFGAEEEILKNKVDEIVQTMHHGETRVFTDEIILELGAGALRKTSRILLSLSRLVNAASTRAPITYYALDLEEREIVRTLGEISASEIGESLQGKVDTKGLCGTYDDGLKFVLEGDEAQLPLHILFLGSSLGNFSREEAVEFLGSLPLRAGSGDTLLIGLDHNNDKAEIEEAYNDPQGLTKEFIMNGLRAAGTALGNEDMFKQKNWEYVNRYDSGRRQHEAFLRSKCDHRVEDPSSPAQFLFLKDELVKIEQSYKFSESDAFSLFSGSNLRPIQRWTDSSKRCSLWLLERPAFVFPPLKRPTTRHNPFGMPTTEQWQQLWSAWDCITQRMIPPSMLYQKPIDLRHICLFYFGHIPTFLDIHLSRLLQEPHTEPEIFKYIFERGIDPNVDDPTQCHVHSTVPEKDEDWPTLTSILQFQTRVRARVLKLYADIDSNRISLTRKVARVLFMTFEHEAHHAETLLYMLIQRAGTGTLPPPGFAIPPWRSLAAIWDSAPLPKTKTVTLGPAEVTLGHDDAETDDMDPLFAKDVDGHEFGWDNEHGVRVVQVGKFSIEWRPVTNGEFFEFYLRKGKGLVEIPASWVKDDGEIKVRTLYGPVPMNVAQHWPVIASYNDLSTYAAVKGGRIPTEAELRLFYDTFDSGYGGGANVGFRNWHPIPATTGLEHGSGSNGGVWEWTSTLFDTYDDFVPSGLYPGYSVDFFDGAHQVVIGASYATIPRIAERKTFRNWYQRNYPYAWVGGRVVYDVKQEEVL